MEGVMGWKKILERIIEDRINRMIDDLEAYAKAKIDELIERLESKLLDKLVH